jgi:hypothetical protein
MRPLPGILYFTARLHKVNAEAGRLQKEIPERFALNQARPGLVEDYGCGDNAGGISAFDVELPSMRIETYGELGFVTTLTVARCGFESALHVPYAVN